MSRWLASPHWWTRKAWDYPVWSWFLAGMCTGVAMWLCSPDPGLRFAPVTLFLWLPLHGAGALIADFLVPEPYPAPGADPAADNVGDQPGQPTPL